MPLQHATTKAPTQKLFAVADWNANHVITGGVLDIGANNFIVDTNVLYVDAATDRVGLGTTTPAVKLTVGTGALHGDFGAVGTGDVLISGKLNVKAQSFWEGGVFIYDNVTIRDGLDLRFGNSEDVKIHWETAGDDSFAIAIGAGSSARSGNIIIMELADDAVNFGHGISANPTLYIQSSDATSTADYLKFWHDQTDGQIACGAGDLVLSSTSDIILQPTGNVGIGTTLPTSKLHVVGLPIYATNALAIAGGLTAGAFYRLGGDPDHVCVVH